MVAVTLVDIVEKDRDFSAAENKYLTQFPSVSWKSIVDGSFESNYETYIADQFFMSCIFCACGAGGAFSCGGTYRPVAVKSS